MALVASRGRWQWTGEGAAPAGFQPSALPFAKQWLQSPQRPLEVCSNERVLSHGAAKQAGEGLLSAAPPSRGGRGWDGVGRRINRRGGEVADAG